MRTHTVKVMGMSCENTSDTRRKKHVKPICKIMWTQLHCDM